MTKRDGIVVVVLAAVMAVGAFWWFALRPLRADLDRLDAEVSTEQVALDSARAQAASAQEAKRRYVRDYATIARLGKAVPADDDLPALVFQLQTAAEGANIDFRSVRLSSAGAAPAPAPAPAAPAAAGASAAAPPGAPAQGAAAQGAAGANAGGPGAATSAGQTPAGAAAAPAPPTQLGSAGLPPGATVGPAGLATMPFTFVFEGSFLRMQQFLRRVQRFVAARDGGIDVDGRLLTIDGIGIDAGGAGFPTIKASITATAYVLPAEEGLTAGATSQAPAAPPAPGTATASSPAPPTPVAAAGGTP